MKKIEIWVIFVIALTVVQACSMKDSNTLEVNENEIDKYLQVSSPDWEDQIIYFIMTDRFMDADSTNNDQGEGEYKKGNDRFWNGGDLAGITSKIGYIKELGATGIWISPPVANQWRNPQHTGTGNHGYWASNFMEVDKHLGTLDDYRKLSATLHKNGMYLIQDVVCNHLGDFYTYNGPYDPGDVTKNFMIYDVAQPTQFPFTHNNALDPADREMGIYHFAPSFYDHSDTIKKRAYQFADLDDLNTSNPIVRDALRKSYNFWIKEVGVDGFRFDTPHMVEHDFWHNFLYSKNEENPGIHRFAAALGKEGFLTFGETVMQTLPYQSKGTYQCRSYLGTEEKPEMSSVLNFPLVNAISRVFIEHKPTDILSYRLNINNKAFERPELLLNFIDNHDGARFLTQTDHESFQQAMLFIMTIPGIPVIYYGTEQELLGMRQAMFKGGVGSPDKDHFITDNESFAFVKGLISMRKEREEFRRGDLTIIQDASDGPGVLAYKLESEDRSAFVLLNTSTAPKLADHVQTGIEAGTILNAIYSLSGQEESIQVDSSGMISILLSPKEGLVLLSGKVKALPEQRESKITFLNPDQPIIKNDFIIINGLAKGIDNLQVMIDGNIQKGETVNFEEDGSWSAKLELKHLLNGTHRISAAHTDAGGKLLTSNNYIEFELELPEGVSSIVEDPAGDDKGPSGDYSYPLHPSYQRQMDIRKVKASARGTNLEIEVEMEQITGIWLPPNGFDHVSLNVYIDLPGMEGAKALPFQNAVMPENEDWDYRVAIGGFDNKLYSSAGAGKFEVGTLTGPTAFCSVEQDQELIKLTVTSEALGYPETLKGTKIYINTWEGGGENPRPLKPEAETWSFGGGQPNDPRIMDDIPIIVLH